MRKHSVPRAVTELSESLIKEKGFSQVRKSVKVVSGGKIEGWNASATKDLMGIDAHDQIMDETNRSGT